MSVFGIQKTTPKQNQQFNEILVNNAKIQELSGFPEQDFKINAGREGALILNNNMIVSNDGNLKVDNIKIDENILKADDENLLWNDNVVITDSTLESELESLGIVIDNRSNLKINRHRGHILLPGTIIQYPLTAKKIPDGWAKCDGTLISKAKYPELIDILAENENTNFLELPNLKKKNLNNLIYLGKIQIFSDK